MRLRIPGVGNLELSQAGLKTRHCICLLAAVSLLSHRGEAQKQKLPEDYALVWSDEFDGENGSVPDASKWTYDIGGSGWGNHELEFYTNRVENARIEDGNLVITARQEAYAGPDGAKFNYTSARLKTKGCSHRRMGDLKHALSSLRGRECGLRSGR